MSQMYWAYHLLLICSNAKKGLQCETDKNKEKREEIAPLYLGTETQPEFERAWGRSKAGSLLARAPERLTGELFFLTWSQ